MRHILIVEDDIAFGTMLQTWLRRKGFEVDKATSVGAAVKLLVDMKSVDLVLSDLRLPDHDGLRLLAWMHEHSINAPFIVMTNYAEVQNAVLAMKSGAADYIAKPVQPDILLQKINDAMEQNAQQSNATIQNSTTQKCANGAQFKTQNSKLKTHCTSLHRGQERSLSTAIQLRRAGGSDANVRSHTRSVGHRQGVRSSPHSRPQSAPRPSVLRTRLRSDSA